MCHLIFIVDDKLISTCCNLLLRGLANLAQWYKNKYNSYCTSNQLFSFMTVIWRSYRTNLLGIPISFPIKYTFSLYSISKKFFLVVSFLTSTFNWLDQSSTFVLHKPSNYKLNYVLINELISFFLISILVIPHLVSKFYETWVR